MKKFVYLPDFVGGVCHSITMNDYELDEMAVSTPCVECGDTLEAWELNETNVCFICEVLG